jgi:2-phosphosulfolactate phosphatase
LVALSVAFEWGEAGARALAPECDVLVVVDVLSFTTAVDVAVGRGAVVLPYPHYDDSAAEFAARQQALLAVGRREQSAERPYSLSPASLGSIPPGTRLVLPSPNGSTISGVAAGLVPRVLAGCLRNATAVAQSCGQVRVGVIAAGERWRDGALRPAFEDLVGAGAIISHLNGGWSPEARSAAAAFREVASELETSLEACTSGQELIAWGFAEDVRLAAQSDVSRGVPRFHDGSFRL